MIIKKKISQLPAADTPLDGTELIEIVQAGANKQVAVSEIGGNGSGEPQTVKVLNVHISGGSNVDLVETEIDNHTLEAGILANDGETIFGNFAGTNVGEDSYKYFKLKIINNGITAEIYDFRTEAGQQLITNSFNILFNILRFSNSVVKIFISLSSQNPGHYTRYLQVSGLDLSLPLTLQLTGQSVTDINYTGYGSNAITAQFSKIFWSATA